MTSNENRGEVEAAGGYGPPGGGYGGPPGGFGGPPGGAMPPGGAGAPPPGGYGGPPPGGYGAPPGGGYGAPGGFGALPPGAGGGAPGMGPKVHPLALVSLITGILSIPACCCWFGLPLPICAIACGIIGLGKVRNYPQVYSGRMFCIIGIVCGSFGLLTSSGFNLSPYGSGFRRRYGRF